MNQYLKIFFNTCCLLLLVNTLQAQEWTEIGRFDPDTDLAKLEYFGEALAVYNDFAVIGSDANDKNGVDAGIAYVFQLISNKWVKIATLGFADAKGNERFGETVAIYDDIIVVGAPNSEINGQFSGAAFLYVKPPSGWQDSNEPYHLTISEPGSSGRLGTSLAIYDDMIAVGAPLDRAYTGPYEASVFIYNKPITGWTNLVETARLTPSIDQNMRFGESVDINENIVVVGASEYFVENEVYNGGLFVFEKPENGYISATETAILTSTTKGSFQLGEKVSIGPDYILAGSNFEIKIEDEVQTYSPGVAFIYNFPENGWSNMTESAILKPNVPDDHNFLRYALYAGNSKAYFAAPSQHLIDNYAGKVYVFEKPSEGWVDMVHTAEIVPEVPDGSYNFGASISGSSQHLLIGNPNDNLGEYSGSVYGYDLSQNNWESDNKFTVQVESAAGDLMGIVDVSGEYVVTGASSDDQVALNAGAVYIIKKEHAGWKRIKKLVAFDGQEFDGYGSEVAIYGNTIVVGSPGHDQGDISNVGAIYIYEKGVNEEWTDQISCSKIIPENAESNDNFGRSIDIHKKIIVSSGLWKGSSESIGKVFVLEKINEFFEITAQLTTNEANARQFGEDVAIFENQISITSTWNNVNDIYLYVNNKEHWANMTESAYMNHEYGGVGFNKQARLVTSLSDSLIFFGNYAPHKEGGFHDGIVTSQPINKFLLEDTKMEMFQGLEINKFEGFAYSFDQSGKHLIVGNLGDSIDENRTGKVYVFDQSTVNSSLNKEVSQLVPIVKQDGANFGESVSIYGSNIVIGAVGENSRAGSVYFFESNEPSVKSVICPNNEVYILGNDLEIAVTLDEHINIEGIPNLILNFNDEIIRNATYKSHEGNTILLGYNIQEGDYFSTVDYQNENSFLYGGDISANDILVNRILPPNGVLNSLGKGCQIFVDGIRPEIVIETESDSYINHSSFEISIQISEEVIKFDENSLNVINGEITEFSKSEEAYRAVINVLEEGLVQIYTPIQTIYDLNNNYNIGSDTLEIVYDITPPEVLIIYPKDSTNENSISIIMELSEGVNTFQAEFLEIERGKITDFIKISQNKYSASITPLMDGFVSIQVKPELFQDKAGNNNQSMEESFRVYFDNSSPIIEYVHDNNTLLSDFDLTINMDEPVKGFNIDDIVCNNCLAENLEKISSQIFKLTLKLSDETQFYFNIEIAEGSFTDVLGNTNNYTISEQILFDKLPVVNLSSESNYLTNQKNIKIDLNLSEFVNDISIGDFNAVNCEITDVSGNSGMSFLFGNLKPLEEGLITIQFKANSITDDTGNTNKDPSNILEFEWDVTAPKLLSWSVEETSAGSFKILVKFSEPVEFLENQFIVEPEINILTTQEDGINQYEILVNKFPADSQLKLNKEVIVDRAGNKLAAGIVLGLESFFKSSEIEFEIYPIPSNDIIKIDMPKNVYGPFSYRIFNLSGKLLISGEILNNSNVIDVKKLTRKKMYIIQIRSENQFGVSKFMKD